MKPEVKKLLIALAIPLGVGGLSALLSGGMQDYLALEKPPLSPPGWVFPVVWTVLYLLMGYASYRVAVKGADAGKTRRALAVYAAQLVLNFLWSILFFGLELRLTAFFQILIFSSRHASSLSGVKVFAILRFSLISSVDL